MFYIHKYFRLIFERREVASFPWTAAPQAAVMLTLVLSQIIFYLLFPVSLVIITARMNIIHQKCSLDIL